MKGLLSTHRQDLEATVVTPEPSAESLIDHIKHNWSTDPSRDLPSLLEEHPELCQHRSLVIDLAVDQYRLRQEQGQLGSIGGYCQPFERFGSALHSSICRQIEVEQYLDAHPELGLKLPEVAWPQVGDTLGDFQVLEKIGAGALAQVFLCAERGLGDRQVVVKVSRHGTQEASTLGKLQHPHIMPVHSIQVHQETDQCYLCTPFLGRSTLHDLLSTAFTEGLPRHGAALRQAATLWVMPSDRYAQIAATDPNPCRGGYMDAVLRLTAKLADALAAAHRAGVLHGDLKPSNVLLTPAGEPVLLDFNLARDDTLGVELRGGTLPYMAPEQIRALLLQEQPAEQGCDKRSEVYSLGAMLYEMLTGQLPYELSSTSRDEETLQHLLARQQQGPLPVTDLNPLVSPSLANLVQRCLAYRPAERVLSMDSLQTQLLGELSWPRRLRRWSKAHPLASAALLSVFLGTIIAVAAWIGHRPPYEVRQYQIGLTHARAGEHTQALEAFERASVADPDYVEAQFASGWTYLALREYKTASEVFLRLHVNYKHAPSLIPEVTCGGYLFNLSNMPCPAIACYERLLEEGDRTALTHNNLGHSYLRHRSRYSKLIATQKAQEQLDLALRLRPTSPTVHRNMVDSDCELIKLRPDHYPSRGIDSLKFLFGQDEMDRETCRFTAELYEAAAQTNPQLLDEGLEFLLRAARQNVAIDLDAIRNSSHTQGLRDHPRFAELVAAVEQQTPPLQTKEIPRFLDPAAEFAWPDGPLPGKASAPINQMAQAGS